MTSVVRDARPPSAVLAILNPVMRTVLPTVLGRLVRPFALIEFRGRRSGRRYRVPAGWHSAEGEAVVFTPAPWRANFAGSADAVVHYRGRTMPMIGTLVTDPATVAAAFRAVLATGTAPRLVGLDVPDAHELTASDVCSVDRAMIRFRPRED